MNNTFTLLSTLNELIPTDGKQRHNITMVDGTLEISLMLGDKHLPVRLEEMDYQKDPVALAHEIAGFHLG